MNDTLTFVCWIVIWYGIFSGLLTAYDLGWFEALLRPLNEWKVFAPVRFCWRCIYDALDVIWQVIRWLLRVETK